MPAPGLLHHPSATTRLAKALREKLVRDPFYESFPRPTHVGSYFRVAVLLKAEYREIV